MPIQALLIFRLDQNIQEPIKLISIFSLPTLWFFQKGHAEEIIIFIGKTVVSRIGYGQQIVEEQGYRCFVYRLEPGVDRKSTNLVCVAIASSDYPNRACFSFLRTSHQLFVEIYPEWENIHDETNLNCPSLVALVDKYQQHEKPNTINNIQNDLDETKDIMIKNIDSLLNRGEKLEDLLDKAENLSKGSKEFLSKTKKLNRCCIII